MPPLFSYNQRVRALHPPLDEVKPADSQAATRELQARPSTRSPAPDTIQSLPRLAMPSASAPHHPGKGQRWPVAATHEQPLQHNLIEGGVGSPGQKPVQLEGKENEH